MSPLLRCATLLALIGCSNGASRLRLQPADDAGATDAIDDLASDAPDAFADDTKPAVDGCATGSCATRNDGCGAREVCGNGLDDNCDGHVDERCPCVPGSVQECFLGPPGRRAVGRCRDGSQRCEGTGEFGQWSACDGVSPSAEACNSLDDDCDGCVDEGLCCQPEVTCPAPGDLRVPDGAPFAAYPLRGGVFYPGAAQRWHWAIAGGPCDTLLSAPTFTVSDSDRQDATFTPTLAGDYTATLTVTTEAGAALSCTFVIHIAGPGLRVELCWDTSTTEDLDLFLHQPGNADPWFDEDGPTYLHITDASCNAGNCKAPFTSADHRVDWGYEPSALDACALGPLGSYWTTLGHCANPRLDIDNNLVMGRGLPENISVDRPRDGERFRVMVHNFSGGAAHPMVTVYCGGHLRGVLGAPPDALSDFTGLPGRSGIGTMWRALDVLVHVDARGETTGCDVTPLHPPHSVSGYFVTRGDPSY